MTPARRWVWAYRLALACAAVSACVSVTAAGPSASAVHPPSSMVATAIAGAAGQSTLAATEAQLGGVVYEGNEIATTPTGDVDTMRFSTTSARFVDLRLENPCQVLSTGAVSTTLLAATALAPAPGGMTFWATSLAWTGTPTYTPAAPPAPAGTPLGDITAAALTVQLVQAQTPDLQLAPGGPAAGLAQFARFCTP